MIPGEGPCDPFWNHGWRTFSNMIEKIRKRITSGKNDIRKHRGYRGIPERHYIQKKISHAFGVLDHIPKGNRSKFLEEHRETYLEEIGELFWRRSEHTSGGNRKTFLEENRKPFLQKVGDIFWRRSGQPSGGNRKTFPEEIEPHFPGKCG